MRIIGSYGTGPGQFIRPYGTSAASVLPQSITPCSVSFGFPLVSGLAFDGSVNMVVVAYGSHRVHVLLTADGSHVRVCGRQGSANGHFWHPFGGVIVDGSGCMVVCDTLNHRVEILQ